MNHPHPHLERPESPHDHDHHRDHAHDEPVPAQTVTPCCGGCGCSAAPLSVNIAEPDGEGGVQTALRIDQMDCPVEEQLLRDRLGRMKGVRGLSFNLVGRVLTVRHDDGTLDTILGAIRELGFTPVAAHGDAITDMPSPPRASRAIWLAGAMAIASEATHWFGAAEWVSAGLAIAAIMACGSGTFRKGWIAVRHGALNINALMSIAVTGALVIGQWPEAAMVMVLFTIAELIEARSLDRARRAIGELVALAPDRVTVQTADGQWVEQRASEVGIGARVRVRPGERIALDGTLVEGRSSVNQAPITGESLPVDKVVGDCVFAGTINLDGAFAFVTTALSNDTTLARIIHAVEKAQSERAPTQRFVDRFARIYTPVVCALALLVAVVPPMTMGGEWLDWVYRALVLLVIACPCALVISTPVSIVSALTAAARRGVLVKGGAYLERAASLRMLALDKTGTVTRGEPAQTSLLTLGDVDVGFAQATAASLAARSDHPVSLAIARHASGQGVAPSEVSDFRALPGRGVEGRIGGRIYRLGNARLMDELGLGSEELDEHIATLPATGASFVVLADEHAALGLFLIADSVRAEAPEAIAALHAMDIHTCMLSGDSTGAVAAIAQRVGIDDARGELLPQDKLTAIAALREAGPTGMVGDGINDAPALASADVGFAMGAATGTAMETADVALMDNDLRKIPAFLQLARDTRRILTQNIAFAIGIKAVFLALTVAGIGTLWMAVFADVGASLIVVGNSLRLLRK
ncbi:heavy metal translocating P-type ATPase [Uliginosibacterium sp. sgz301328]|uniref:heavy metal translocating P-type ATPase n=1 Tax=Uliginosibacterium sp. sgz301328 TaxID=3243764 RepID=UPI00359EC59A